MATNALNLHVRTSHSSFSNGIPIIRSNIAWLEDSLLGRWSGHHFFRSFQWDCGSPIWWTWHHRLAFRIRSTSNLWAGTKVSSDFQHVPLHVKVANAMSVLSIYIRFCVCTAEREVPTVKVHTHTPSSTPTSTSISLKFLISTHAAYYRIFTASVC